MTALPGAHLILYGPPRTKKTSNRVFKLRNGRRKYMPSAAWEKWVATVEKLVLWAPTGAIDYPVSCRAMFYRHALVGDAVGFYQGLGDLLQEHRILTNDKLIVHWDGSRLLKDAANPRVELWLEPAV